MSISVNTLPIHSALAFSCLCILLTGSSIGYGQNSDSLSTSTPDRQKVQPAFKGDTLAMRKTYALTPFVSDTFMPPDLQAHRNYDPALVQVHQARIRLSNLGTASFPIMGAISRPVGFHIGDAVWQPYIYDTDSLYFIRSHTPYSDVYYSQGTTSEDGLFRGIVSRRFGKGTDFVLEGMRVYNLGVYSHLQNHHSTLRTGLRWQLPNGKYAVSLLHGNHIIDQEENGGVTTDTLFSAANYTEADIPVWLSDAKYRYRVIDYTLHQAYALRGKVDEDSTGTFVIHHALRYATHKWKFSDTRPPLDYYGLFLVDERGLRNFIDWNTLTNHGGIRFGYRNQQGNAIAIEGGIEHRLHRWDNTISRQSLSNLLVIGGISFRWKNRVDIAVKGRMDLGDQQGAWQMDGEAGMELGKWATLSGGIVLNRSAPSFFENNLIVSGRTVYEHDWRFSTTQSIHATLAIPVVQLVLGVRADILQNTIIFSAPGVPEQIQRSVHRQQFWAAHQLRLKWFHLDQQLSLQSTTDDRLPVPKWITHHNLYYQDRWFKKSLQVQLGAELRFISAWKAPGYLPLHSQFYYQSAITQPAFPQLDVYVAAERMGFRFFLEWENVGRMIFGWKQQDTNGRSHDAVFYQTTGYPMPTNWLRFGLAFTLRG